VAAALAVREVVRQAIALATVEVCSRLVARLPAALEKNAADAGPIQLEGNGDTCHAGPDDADLRLEQVGRKRLAAVDDHRRGSRNRTRGRAGPGRSKVVSRGLF